jgi:hypothetical protein
MSAFFMTISMCMNENLEYFTICTLVDITKTNVVRNTPESEFQRNQQRNWESVLQVIGLRAQPMTVVEPVGDIVSADIVAELFGEMHHGKDQRVWVASFAVEHKEVFLKDDDLLGLLKDDFNQVPVVCGLDETARFILPIFYSHGSLKNITFRVGNLFNR